MKGILSLIILSIIAILLFKCDQHNIEERFIYEEQDSELALLMREIHSQAKVLKTHIVKDESLPSYNNNIDFIVDATPTKENVKGVEFDAMALYFLQMNEDLYAHPDKEKYNEMVESCVACHQSFCPGPIKTIKKLTIK